MLSLADDVEKTLVQAGEAERPGAGRREVDDAAADERSPIVDAHHYRAPVALIGDPHQRAERQRAVRRGRVAPGDTLSPSAVRPPE